MNLISKNNVKLIFSHQITGFISKSKTNLIKIVYKTIIISFEQIRIYFQKLSQNLIFVVDVTE